MPKRTKLREYEVRLEFATGKDHVEHFQATSAQHALEQYEQDPFPEESVKLTVRPKVVLIPIARERQSRTWKLS